MGDFIPQPPGLGTGAGRAQWAGKPGGASGIARSDTCGATMRVPRFSPKTPSSLCAYRSFLSENSMKRETILYVWGGCFLHPPRTVPKSLWVVWRAAALQMESESGDMCGGFGSLAEQGFLALFPAREPSRGERETA